MRVNLADSADRVPDTSRQRPAVIAGFLGWTLDAFDYFLVVYCLTAIAKDFHKSDAEMAFALTLTLMFRPVGALVFGLLADRYGRRRPLMANLVFISVIEVATGFAPGFGLFLIFSKAFFSSHEGDKISEDQS